MSFFYKGRTSDTLYYTTKNTAPLAKTLFGNIQNAPALQHLSLDYTEIGLGDMVTIHQACPLLETLSFQNVKLRIITATSLKNKGATAASINLKEYNLQLG
jgi:hypothetical protein